MSCAYDVMVKDDKSLHVIEGSFKMELALFNNVTKEWLTVLGDLTMEETKELGRKIIAAAESYDGL